MLAIYYNKHITENDASHVKEIRDNMKMPLDLLLTEAGFENIRILKKKWGIFSYIHANKTR